MRERWNAQEFERVNFATVESKVIPKLHHLFEKKGVSEGYLVLDAKELAFGFPVNVNTRHIFPVLDEEGVAMDSSGDDPCPGLIIAETLGLGTRSIDIKIGLDPEDLWKIAIRAKHEA